MVKGSCLKACYSYVASKTLRKLWGLTYKLCDRPTWFIRNWHFRVHYGKGIQIGQLDFHQNSKHIRVTRPHNITNFRIPSLGSPIINKLQHHHTPPLREASESIAESLPKACNSATRISPSLEATWKRIELSVDLWFRTDLLLWKLLRLRFSFTDVVQNIKYQPVWNSKECFQWSWKIINITLD